MSVEEQEIQIPSDLKGSLKCRAAVYANDPTGVVLLDVLEGDTIGIDTITGWCTFSDGSLKGKIAKNLVSYGVPLLAGNLPKIAQQAIGKLKKDANFMGKAPSKGKARNGYGRVNGKDRFAVKEGGVIVCMPSAEEPINAYSGSHLDGDAEKAGRLHRYVKADLKDHCFFPFPKRKGGRKEMTASVGGLAWILAFDGKHTDNAGVYDVRFTVVRPS